MALYFSPQGRSLELITRLHLALYRSTGGVIGRRLIVMPCLLLTTRGRRSKLLRTLPLPYFQDGDELVVIASNAAQPKHPAWYHNVRADPRVTVQVGSELFAARAEVASGERRARIWQAVTRAQPRYAHYQSQVEREIPLVLLRRDVG